MRTKRRFPSSELSSAAPKGMTKGALETLEARRTRAFISNSRQDSAFALSLRSRLQGEGFHAYLDVHDIVKGFLPSLR
jgi:hypothetical protein